MADAWQPRPLTVADLGPQLDPTTFGFATTDELSPLDEIVGQPRAERAFEIGVGVRQIGYHVFVSGVSGSGRMELARRVLTARAEAESVSQDWVYVNNFENSEEPQAMALPAGQGVQLQRDLAGLIGRLMDELPKAFQREDFSQEKERLRKGYQEKGAELFAELQKQAKQREFAVQQVSDHQVIFMPLKDGEPISDEAAQKLSPEEMERIERSQRELFEVLETMAQKQAEIERQLSTDVRQVERTFATRLIEPLLQEIADRYQNEQVTQWLERLKSHFIRNLDRFRRRADRLQDQMTAILGDVPQSDLQERFMEYQVNLVVDNSTEQHAPVVFEPAPNYRNLFGTIERVVDRLGHVATNFTRIRAGSLLRANGGYLVFDLEDALQEPFVWKQLKRTLKTGSSRIEVYDPFEMFTVATLRPEPIPLDVKLVVLGHPLLYHLLYLYDDDFRELFKVKAEFDTDIPLKVEAGGIYGRLVKKLSATEGIPAFDAAAVAALIWASARLVGDRRRLTAEFRRIADLIREAAYWARTESATVVGAAHVRRAIDEQTYRSDLLSEKIRDLISDGTLHIRLGEPAVGSIHGLTVADLGDYAAGWPVRLSASVGVGTEGVINIERESRLSGKTFDKGMLILEGYLRNQYARQHPLALSASLALEQTYGGVDGDSASAAELLCLLSAIAGIPLRQDIAITGSINQLGEVQAIGAVTEKVEGFFDVCRQLGLTGQQGVCIPLANVKHLVPRDEVLAAIERGEFHLWPIENVDQGIVLLTGLPAGSPSVENSFHGRVDQSLRQMLAVLKDYQPSSAASGQRLAVAESGTPQDPRPPLPGRPGNI